MMWSEERLWNICVLQRVAYAFPDFLNKVDLREVMCWAVQWI
jgi:hypothetical protein